MFNISDHGKCLYDLNTLEVQQLISQHPALVELNLPLYRVKAGDIIQLVHQLSLLKTFQCRIHRDSAERSLLETQLNDECKFSSDKLRYTKS